MDLGQRQEPLEEEELLSGKLLEQLDLVRTEKGRRLH
jgi:hypothetical protein